MKIRTKDITINMIFESHSYLKVKEAKGKKVEKLFLLNA